MNTPESKPNPEHPASPPLAPPAPKKRRGWVWVILGCVAVLLVLAFVLHRRPAVEAGRGTGRGRSGAGAGPVPVTTAVVHQGDVGIYVSALGTVTPLYTVQVKTRVDGQLMTVNYVEGQMVKVGDSLVEVDPRPYQAQLTQAEGQLARDQALLENARVDLDRYKIAFSSNAIPQQQLSTQVATVHQFEGSVKFDQGQVDTAKLNLVYAHVTSPISGRVGLRLVDPGNIVHATDTNPLAVITQLQPISVLFSITEDFLPDILRQLNAGQKLPVQALDRSQQQTLATGTLVTVDNQIDPTTGTVRLRALFANEDNALFPSQFVNAKLLVSTKHNATVVPTIALQRNAQGAFVYLVQPNQTVTMHAVTVGPTDGNITAVEGVKPGDVIAADNFNRLQEGAKVAVAKAGEGPVQGEKNTNVAAEAP